MAILRIAPTKYLLPEFLVGQVTPQEYSNWLGCKARDILKRDKKRRKPFALNADGRVYAEKIHDAVTKSGKYDPYTGDLLAWDLIGMWDTSHKHSDGYEKQFALLPTVDHIDPGVLEFEICSWQSNKCKTDLLPEEFVEFCRKVVEYRSAK